MSDRPAARVTSGAPIVSWARWIYRIGAVSNWAVTVPAFLFYDRYLDAFTSVRPTYPALVWIWSGMAFLWGVAFWEISRDPVGAYRLVKYSWLEKSITSASILVGWWIGDVPGRLAVGVLFTDLVWVPLFLGVHVGLARLVRARSAAAGGE